MRNTPAQAGFHMPAEWEKHEGTWLQWPYDDTHPGYQMRLEHVVANNVVLVPVYGDVTDARAKAIVAEHFPGREIVGILAHTLAELGGMIHCVTQQQPVSRFKETS